MSSIFNAYPVDAWHYSHCTSRRNRAHLFAPCLTSYPANIIVELFQESAQHALAENLDGMNEGEEVMAFSQLVLPNQAISGMFESLVFDEGVKQRLLAYAASALLFRWVGVYLGFAYLGLLYIWVCCIFGFCVLVYLIVFDSWCYYVSWMYLFMYQRISYVFNTNQYKSHDTNPHSATNK